MRSAPLLLLLPVLSLATARAAVTRSIVESYSAVDPAAAAAWILSLPTDSGERDSLIFSSLSQWPPSEPILGHVSISGGIVTLFLLGAGEIPFSASLISDDRRSGEQELLSLTAADFFAMPDDPENPSAAGHFTYSGTFDLPRRDSGSLRGLRLNFQVQAADGSTRTIPLEITAVPEPGTFALVSATALLALRRRRWKTPPVPASSQET